MRGDEENAFCVLFWKNLLEGTLASGNDGLGYLDQYLFKDNWQFWIKIERICEQGGEKFLDQNQANMK